MAIKMKTKGKPWFKMLEIIMIDGKIYKPVVRPIYVMGQIRDYTMDLIEIISEDEEKTA